MNYSMKNLFDNLFLLPAIAVLGFTVASTVFTVLIDTSTI